MPNAESTTAVMEEIKKLNETIKTGKHVIKASYFTKAYDAILNLHERLASLESRESGR
jgi:hypothetical protein